jgi:hypothetical protein
LEAKRFFSAIFVVSDMQKRALRKNAKIIAELTLALAALRSAKKQSTYLVPRSYQRKNNCSTSFTACEAVTCFLQRSYSF